MLVSTATGWFLHTCSFAPFFLAGVMNALETSKTEDMRQCTLCQQYGDSAPRVSSMTAGFTNTRCVSCKKSSKPNNYFKSKNGFFSQRRIN